MGPARSKDLHLEIDDLPPDVASAIEAVTTGGAIALFRSGRQIGTLEFCSHVLEGSVVVGPGRDSPAASADVTVVATAMKLSESARRRLSDEFGADYVVLDMHAAPTTADVLLVPPISSQLIGMLKNQFPDAQIVVAEIEDEELGVSYLGPVSRMLDAGANAYLPPRPIAELAAGLHAYLAQSDAKILESGPGPSATRSALSANPSET